MGFLDKVGGAIKRLKEDNKNMGTTTKRINNVSDFYGNVNRGVKDGDFWMGSYVSIENGQGVIYGSSQDDYTFTADDIASFEMSNAPKTKINVGNKEYYALRYIITFKDGKKASADIIVGKIDDFKRFFGI